MTFRQWQGIAAIWYNHLSLANLNHILHILDDLHLRVRIRHQNTTVSDPLQFIRVECHGFKTEHTLRDVGCLDNMLNCLTDLMTVKDD